MKWNVRLFYTGYIEKEIEAKCGASAIKIAREQVDKAFSSAPEYIDNYSPIINTLEPWKDADEVLPVDEAEYNKVVCGNCEGSGKIGPDGELMEAEFDPDIVPGNECPNCKGSGFTFCLDSDCDKSCETEEKEEEVGDDE